MERPWCRIAGVNGFHFTKKNNMSLLTFLEPTHLFQTIVLALSIFNLVTFLWLAFTVWLNGNRQAWIARLGVVGFGDGVEGGLAFADAVAVADDQGELGEQAWEGVADVAVRVLLRRGFAFGGGGAFGLGDRVGGERRLLVLEEQWRPGGAEVPFEVVGEQAEEGVGADAVFAAVADRADLELGALEGAEGAFGVGELLVGADDLGSGERVVGEVGAQDVEAVQGRLLLDLLLFAAVLEAVVGDLLRDPEVVPLDRLDLSRHLRESEIVGTDSHIIGRWCGSPILVH